MGCDGYIFRVTDLYFSVIAAFLGIYFTKPSVIIANTSECFLLAPSEPLKNFSMLSDFDLVLRVDIFKILTGSKKDDPDITSHIPQGKHAHK